MADNVENGTVQERHDLVAALQVLQEKNDTFSSQQQAYTLLFTFLFAEMQRRDPGFAEAIYKKILALPPSQEKSFAINIFNNQLG
ncbi:hypothetical protein ACO0LO_16640 [Undibacterium sp. TJN25]|uniref:hypothetical protein n=1 Tax=Undibacterium sp. TJN25 TaxID=3413056 RepID=UPI003BF1BA97